MLYAAVQLDILQSHEYNMLRRRRRRIGTIMNERKTRIAHTKKLPICVRRGCSTLQLEFLFDEKHVLFNFSILKCYLMHALRKVYRMFTH